MAYSVMIHLLNEDAIAGEIDRIPEPTDQFLVARDVRRRDGREVSYIMPDTSTVVFPWARIHCIEILSSGDQQEEVVSFIRE